MEPVTSPTDTQKSTSSLLFCRACQSVYQQPKLLPCLHSFCRPCLVQATTNGSDGAFISCPLCSHKSPLPASGMVGVPDNLFLNRMCQEYLTEVQNHLVSRSLNHLNPRRTLELNTSSTDRSSATPGGKYTSWSGFRSQYTAQDVSQHDGDENTAADQSSESGQSFDRGSPSGQSTANAVEAIRNMSRLQTKVLSLQGEALRVTYAIDQVNQAMIDWHQHKEELKKAVQRRTTQFQFYLQRMEHQLIAQIDSKQTDDLFYTESDKSKMELRKILNNILHEVSVLKSIQEFGKDAEIISLSPILLGRSVGMADVMLKKPHFELEFPKSTIEEIVGENFGVIQFNSEESEVFVPEVSDFSDISVGNLAQTQTGTANTPGNVGGGEIVAKVNEEPINASTGRTLTRRSVDRRSRRHNTDLGLDKEDVKEYLAQFQNARENLRARRKEILERGRQASEDASPLMDEINRRPRSTSRNSRGQSLDRVGLPVTSSRRATLPSGLALHELKLLNFPMPVQPEVLPSALQEDSSHFQDEPSDGLNDDLSISGLTPEDQSSVSKNLPLLASHQKILVKQTSDPRYTRESPTSPKETHSSEILYPTHSRSFIEELRNRRLSNPSNSIFERRFSDQLNSLPPGENEELLQHDIATTRPVRRAISSAADRQAKIEFLRENWQKRKEILIQNEGFVSPDTNKVLKTQPQTQSTEEEDDSEVQISETVEATGQDLSSPPSVPTAYPKFESMHTIRSRVAQYRTELTKNEDKGEDKVMERAPVSPSTQISDSFRSDLQRQKYFTSQTVVSPTFKAPETTSPTSQTVVSPTFKAPETTSPTSQSVVSPTFKTPETTYPTSQTTTSANERISSPIQTEVHNLTNQIASQIPTNQIESQLYTNQRAPQRSTNEAPPIPKYKTTSEVESQIPTNHHIPRSTTASTNIQEKPSVSEFPVQTASITTTASTIIQEKPSVSAFPVQTASITTTASTIIQEKPSVLAFPVQTASITTTETTIETITAPTYSRYSRYQAKVEPIDIASLIAAMYSGNMKKETPPETASTLSATTQATSITTGNTLPTGSSRAVESTSTTATSLTATPSTYYTRYQTENKSQLTGSHNENEGQQTVLRKDEQTSKPEQESLARQYRYPGLYSRYNNQVTNSINTTAITTTTTAIPSATSNFTPTESINTKSSTEALAAESSTISYRSQRVALKDSALPPQASPMNTTEKSDESTQQAQPKPHLYGLNSRYTAPVNKPVTTASVSITTSITTADNTSSRYSILSSVGESTMTPSRYQTEHLKETTPPEQVTSANISEQSDEPTKQSQLKPSRSKIRSRFTDGVNRRHTIEIGKEAIQSALKLYSKQESTPAHQTTLDAISESPAATHTQAYMPYLSRLSDPPSKVLESTNGTTAAVPASAEPLENNDIKDTIISYKIRASGVTTKIIPKSLEVIQEKFTYDQSQTPKATSVIAPAPVTPPSPSLLSLSPDEVAQKVKLREIARKKKERWRHMTIH